MTMTSIIDQLKILIQLQEIDAQIYKLKQERVRKPAAAAQLKSQHEQAGISIRAVEDQYKALEIKRNQMEMDLAKKETEVIKHQGQLFQLKTNKEYAAMQKEIEGLKADKSVLEEEILKLMEDVDRVKGKLTTERLALKENEAALNASLKQIDEELKKIQDSIQQLQVSRAQLTPKIDAPILARYERILDNKGERALVPIKGNACGGCYMELPPQLINEVHLATRLVACESCARILTVDPAP